VNKLIFCEIISIFGGLFLHQDAQMTSTNEYMNFIRKISYLTSILCFVSFSSQQKMKDYSKIMSSKSIYEIDAFLRDAHPDDPKRLILKPRLVELLRDYIKNALPGDQRVKGFQEKLIILNTKPSTKITFEEINEKIREKQIAAFRKKLESKELKNYNASTADPTIEQTSSASKGIINSEEEEEFNMLMSENPTEHKDKTVKVLNSLFDNDPNSKESIVMIENKSDCNMIMRIEGVGYSKYRLAIPAKDDNAIVVAKGDYLFSSIVCGTQYTSQKTVQRSIIVSLGSSKPK
jgi:hypothetical protein